VGKLPKQTKRRVLIKRFKELGWTGPHIGVKGRAGDHPSYMAWTAPDDPDDQRTVKLPNPHRSDIGEGLLKKIIAEAGLSEAEWLGTSQAKGEDVSGQEPAEESAENEKAPPG